jgi:hypothetical protein
MNPVLSIQEIEYYCEVYKDDIDYSKVIESINFWLELKENKQEKIQEVLK